MNTIKPFSNGPPKRRRSSINTSRTRITNGNGTTTGSVRTLTLLAS